MSPPKLSVVITRLDTTAVVLSKTRFAFHNGARRNGGTQ
jgi:hypothetical protein